MSTKGMSHPRAVTPVPDPVHTRYEFNIFDRSLIDSTYFQRLHFVLQNSTNYVSFPSNKNTRFPHSLGVSHVAGRLFANGLSHASDADLRAFLTRAAKFLVALIEKVDPFTPMSAGKDNRFANYRDAHAATISGFSGFLHTPLVEMEQRVDTETLFGAPRRQFTAAFIVDTFWQALRLYGLMHDIGHLPMSHASEVALKNVPTVLETFGGKPADVIRYSKLYRARLKEFTGLQHVVEREAYVRFFAELLGVDEELVSRQIFEKAFHEVRGLSVYNRLIRDQSTVIPPGAQWSRSVDIQKYGDLIYNLSVCLILSMPQQNVQASPGDHSADCAMLHAIRRLVDGDVDADRLDYTLRDCEEAGSKLGSFDLERVVTNSLLLRRGVGDEFAFGFHFHGISGIEQFFEQRYSSYKYIIHQRTASRSNSVLEYLISLLFAHTFKYPTGPCAVVMEHYGYISRSGGRVVSILPDNVEVIERIDDAALRTMLFDLRPVFRGAARDAGGRALHEQIAVCLDIVLLRGFEHIQTAFKNQRAIDVIRAAVPADMQRGHLQSFSDALLLQLPEITKELKGRFRELEIDGEPVHCGILLELIKPKVFESKKKSHRVTPFEETVWIFTGRPQPIPLVSASAALRGTRRRVKPEQQVRIYLVAKNLRERPRLKAKFESILAEFLRERWRQYAERINH